MDAKQITHDEALKAINDKHLGKDGTGLLAQCIRDYIAQQRAACARLAACEEALRFYAKHESWSRKDGPSNAVLDSGNLALAALKEPARG